MQKSRLTAFIHSKSNHLHVIADCYFDLKTDLVILQPKLQKFSGLHNQSKRFINSNTNLY